MKDKHESVLILSEEKENPPSKMNKRVKTFIFSHFFLKNMEKLFFERRRRVIFGKVEADG